MEHVRNGWDFSTDTLSGFEGNEGTDRSRVGRTRKEKAGNMFSFTLQTSQGLALTRKPCEINGKGSGKEFVQISALLFPFSEIFYFLPS